ncbi:MAG TPA: methyltransferase domain-containing protein, partial [Mycobacteriales bacterium]|nr:methyltransferase domain-containing protein [Mycobacteriales bacterium]
MTAEAAATPLRDALVDRLCQWHVIRTEAIEAALRSVPRHRFVPEVSIEAAYEDKPIPTKWKADGSPSSSASQPMIVAWQLEQLGAQPGDRILEIGAGTGYNAALLAELVGQSGEVTSVEFDPDMAERARHTLADTGYKSVRVITADGEYGCADRAPYDRIIVTTGAWDIPPAWADQLIPNGRLVVPLRLPGWPISIAFQRNEGLWRSISTHSLGFIP